MGDRRGCLLNDALLYLLLLLQRLDKRSFKTIRMLGFQSLLLIGRHAVFTENCPSFSLILPPAAGEVSIALGADEGLSAS